MEIVDGPCLRVVLFKVDGIGAVAVPVPPVAAVYHSRLVPVAVSAVAVPPWQ